MRCQRRNKKFILKHNIFYLFFLIKLQQMRKNLITKQYWQQIDRQLKQLEREAQLQAQSQLFVEEEGGSSSSCIFIPQQQYIKSTITNRDLLHPSDQKQDSVTSQGHLSINTFDFSAARSNMHTSNYLQHKVQAYQKIKGCYPVKFEKKQQQVLPGVVQTDSIQNQMQDKHQGINHQDKKKCQTLISRNRIQDLIAKCRFQKKDKKQWKQKVIKKSKRIEKEKKRDNMTNTIHNGIIDHFL